MGEKPKHRFPSPWFGIMRCMSFHRIGPIVLKVPDYGSGVIDLCDSNMLQTAHLDWTLCVTGSESMRSWLEVMTNHSPILRPIFPIIFTLVNVMIIFDREAR